MQSQIVSAQTLLLSVVISQEALNNVLKTSNVTGLMVIIKQLEVILTAASLALSHANHHSTTKQLMFKTLILQHQS